MKFDDLVSTSAAVAATSGRLEKIARLADLFTRLSADEIPIAVGFLIGWPRQGKLGVGWAAVSKAREHAPATTATLELREIDAVFDKLSSTRGRNSTAERARQLEQLFTRATADEQRFLSGLIVGEIRQGALEGVLVEAIAKAASVPADRVRRAAMLTGDLGVVATAALGDNRETALADYQLQLFRPVQPMLADSANSVADAIAGGEPVIIEWKIDGARIQVHRQDDRVAVYTRSLNDVTDAVPEVVEAVRRLPWTKTSPNLSVPTNPLGSRELILDGEVIALSGSGRPLSFQDTMRRFGRRINVLKLRDELPLSPFFFDVLYSDGVTLIDEPLTQRLELLDSIVPENLRIPRIVTANIEDAQIFQADALVRGHEGVMIKSTTAPYAAGRRGSAWIKVKEARTLDLVVLAIEWGSGRRQGWLSNIHMAARDPATGEFVMLGKTFKGMTDEMLEWQTKEFLAREVRREGHVVHVRPEVVVEVAFNEVQRSTQYPGGVALRFARVKGYRPDKSAEEADTIESVRAFLPEAG
ncbi:MAG: ATP-dependent DNA ligase [Gemmatimonadaceae bacterium]